MKSRSFQSYVFAFVLVICFALPLGHSLARPSDTVVGGPILADTTWTAANSPYLVTSNIDVTQGVTLTIEPGVTVKFDVQKKLQVNGTLIAQGTDEAPIRFTSAQANPQPGDWDNIEFTGTSTPSDIGPNGEYQGGSLLQYCVLEYGGSGNVALELHGILIDHCTVQKSKYAGIETRDPYTTQIASYISNSLITQNPGLGVHLTSGSTIISSTVSYNGGGINSVDESQILNNMIVGNNIASIYFAKGAGINAIGGTIHGNIILGNIAGDNGGGIYATSVTITDNLIANNESASYGGGAWVGYNIIFTGNTLIGNKAEHGAGLRYNAVAGVTILIANNTFVGNESSDAQGAAYEGTGELHSNTLYENIPYDISTVTYPYSNCEIDATNNYFGTTDSATILAHIYDFYDASDYCKVLFNPFLDAPDPTTPVAPPLGLTAQMLPNGAIQVNWESLPSFIASPAASVSGYRVYYNDTGLPPFDGTGQPAGDSPIDVGLVTSLTLTSPFPKFVTVTAYDDQGHESWFAPILALSTTREIYLPLTIR